MFRKSFNAAKCKTKLKLAESRIKLMKNKRTEDLKQRRKEVAQLLSSRKDKTAMIQVEHVVREDNMIAAYELIAMYCDLIVNYLPTIQAQRNCPIDLKEAVTGIIFAAPRCVAEIPELKDVADKQLKVKYGKEFVTAVVELRPQCGVNRILIEKLSVIAPDGPTKVKILIAIAEENNFKWEPNWFDEKDPNPPEYSNSWKTDSTQINTSNFQFDSNWEASSRQEGVSSSTTTTPAPNLREFRSFEPRREVHNPSSFHSRTSSSGSSFNRQADPTLDTIYDDPSSTNTHPVDKHEYRDANHAAQVAARYAEEANMALKAASFLSGDGNEDPINHVTESSRGHGSFSDKGSSSVGSGIFRTGSAVSLSESVSSSRAESTRKADSSAAVTESVLQRNSSSASSYSAWEKAELLRWAEDLPEEEEYNSVRPTEISQERDGSSDEEDFVRRKGSGHLHPNQPEDFETLVHRVKSLG